MDVIIRGLRIFGSLLPPMINFIIDFVELDSEPKDKLPKRHVKLDWPKR